MRILLFVYPYLQSREAVATLNIGGDHGVANSQCRRGCGYEGLLDLWA